MQHRNLVYFMLSLVELQYELMESQENATQKFLYGANDEKQCSARVSMMQQIQKAKFCRPTKFKDTGKNNLDINFSFTKFAEWQIPVNSVYILVLAMAFKTVRLNMGSK